MIAKYIFRDFHLVTAKRPLYQPNIPETFADRDFAEENVNGHYRNHLFDIPHVTAKVLSRLVACVGSGDPVRVLRLYTTNTLDEVCSIYC